MKKKRKKKLFKMITLVAAILAIPASLFAVLGVSVFNGKPLSYMMQYINSIIAGINTPTSTAPPESTTIIVYVTSEPEHPTTISGDTTKVTSPEDPSNIQPITMPENISLEKDAGDTTVFKLETTKQESDNQTKTKTTNGQKNNATNSESKTSKKDSTSDSGDSQKDGTTNSDPEDNTAVSATEEPAITNNEEEPQAITAKLGIQSPGYLRLTAKNSIKQANKESTIDISKTTDEYGNILESPGASFNYSEIVNDNLDHESGIIYIPVSIGIYNFTFINCEIENIENLEISFTEYDIGNTADGEDTLGNDNSAGEKTVPSQEDWSFDVTQEQPEISCDFKAEKSFTPLIQFYSEDVNEAEIYITISDRENNNLQTIKLNQTNEYGNQEIMGKFNFIENEEYHLVLSSDIELDTVKCFLSFVEIEDEE